MSVAERRWSGRRSSAGLTGLVAVVVLALTALPVAARPTGGAVGFSIAASGTTVIGGADVTLTMTGELAAEAGLAPCAGGDVDEGSLTVSDGDESHTAVFTYGVATAGCVPGFSNGVYVEARGYWESLQVQPFTLRMIATRTADGSLEDLVGEIVSSDGGDGNGATSFSGRFRGAGDTSGLGVSAATAAPDTTTIDRLLATLPPDSADAMPKDDTTGKFPTVGPKFTLSLDTKLSLGDGRFVLHLSGIVYNGGGSCATGQPTAGVITIADDDTIFRGVVQSGYVTSCDGGSKGVSKTTKVSFSVNGFMKDNPGTPFYISGSGKLGAGGRISSVAARVFAYPQSFRPNVIDEVEQLRVSVAVYGGNVTGTGVVDKLVAPSRPDPNQIERTFRVQLSGDDGQHFVIDIAGQLLGRGRGSATFRPRTSTLTVGTTTYLLQIQTIDLRLGQAGAGRFVLLGTLLPPATPPEAKPHKPVGFIIAELRGAATPPNLFTRGGKVEIGGRVASLKVNTRTYHPDLTGTVTVKVVES